MEVAVLDGLGVAGVVGIGVDIGHVAGQGLALDGEGGGVKDVQGAVLELLGGADNIVDVTNCVTRLRVNVKDETLVADDPDFKSIGTSGIAKNGKGMQVIIGLKVPKVRDRFEALL